MFQKEWRKGTLNQIKVLNFARKDKFQQHFNKGIRKYILQPTAAIWEGNIHSQKGKIRISKAKITTPRLEENHQRGKKFQFFQGDQSRLISGDSIQSDGTPVECSPFILLCECP